MKQIAIIFFAALCLLANDCIAQSKFVGTWEGTLNVGASIRLVFHIEETDGQLNATMDSPDQGAMGLPCSGASVNGDTLEVKMANIGGKYVGVMRDANNIAGTWHQGSKEMQLDIKKTEKVLKLNRPQTPKPPYSYISEDIVYHNADSSIQYGATITIPHGKGPFPGLLLITGSGQQNRDEELFEHKPFAVIADYLTKAGYVVLRVDDRGVGQSTGDVRNATSEDFAKDVMVSLNYLESRKEVNRKKVGLLGHSEGGMIAPMVAVQRPDVAFVVLMAGPGVEIAQLMEEQSAAMLRESGMDDNIARKYLALYRNMVHDVIAAKDKEQLTEDINKDVSAWRTKTPDSVVMATTNIHDDATQQMFVNKCVKDFSNPWFHYFIAYDPQPVLEKLTCKVLALNGSRDDQVVPVHNLAGMREALAKSKSKEYEVIEVPGANHLFQTCKTCTIEEYSQLEETISPAVLKTIGDWLDKNVK